MTCLHETPKKQSQDNELKNYANWRYTAYGAIVKHTQIPDLSMRQHGRICQWCLEVGIWESKKCNMKNHCFPSTFFLRPRASSGAATTVRAKIGPKLASPMRLTGPLICAHCAIPPQSVEVAPTNDLVGRTQDSVKNDQRWAKIRWDLNIKPWHNPFQGV